MSDRAHEQALAAVAKSLVPTGQGEVTNTELQGAYRLVDTWLHGISGVHLASLAEPGQISTRMRPIFSDESDALLGFRVEAWCQDCFGDGCRLCHLEREDDEREARGDQRRAPHVRNHGDHGCRACRNQGWVPRD